MRDPERIDKFCDQLKEYWHKVPEWRFGQLIENVYSKNHIQDGFFVEDDKLLKLFEEYFFEREDK